MPPWGKGPVQQKIHNDPNYIPNEFPLLDKFETCTVIIRRPGEEEEASLDAGDRGDDVFDPDEEEQEEGGGAKNDGVPGDTDDPVKLEQRQLESAQETLGPFEDMMQLGLVVGGIIVLVLGLAAISRKNRKKTHKH